MRAYVERKEGLEIWTSTTAGEHAHRELALNGHAALESATGVGSFSFSVDRKRLYFVSSNDANATPLWAVELGRGSVSQLADHTDSYRVVERCHHQPFVDHLVVHRSHLMVGPIHFPGEQFWLLSADGRDVGRIGPSDDNVARFLAKTCRVGEAPPAPEAAPRPPELEKLPMKCGGATIIAQETSLLDGTREVIFAVRDDAVPAPDSRPTGMTLDQARTYVARHCSRTIP